MRKGSEHPDAARKKQVGDLLRNADRLLKEGDYEQALAEVEKGLQLEPGNFYAQAYRDRITALREKHRPSGQGGPEADRSGPPPAAGESTAPAPAGPVGLREVPGGRIEEVPDEEPPPPDAKHRGVEDLREQIARDREAQEHEAGKQAEAMARSALEQELQAAESAGRLRAAEQEALAAAEAAAKEEARTTLAGRAAQAFERLLGAGDTMGAFREMTRLGLFDPSDARLQDMARRLDAAAEAAAAPPDSGSDADIRATALDAYRPLLRAAWEEGAPDGAQAAILAEARERLGVSPAQEREMLPGVQREIMTAAMREAYRSGEPDPETRSFLDRLSRELAGAAPGKT